MNTRVAFVTGGSRGIGRAACVRLARDGFDVAFCYATNHEAAAEVEKEIVRAGRRAFAFRADVSDAEQVRAFVREGQSALGPVDVVVASAGVTRDNPLLLMTDDDWRSVMSTNLDGVYNICRSVVFDMLKRRSGSIINVSSVAGVYGNATQSNYSAAKAGIIGFSSSLAKEVGKYGVRVNSIAPGFIDTDVTSSLNDKVIARALEQIPLGRVGTATEVADLISFLAGDQSTYITGSTLHVDGGISL